MSSDLALLIEHAIWTVLPLPIYNIAAAAYKIMAGTFTSTETAWQKLSAIWIFPAWIEVPMLVAFVTIWATRRAARTLSRGVLMSARHERAGGSLVPAVNAILAIVAGAVINGVVAYVWLIRPMQLQHTTIASQFTAGMIPAAVPVVLLVIGRVSAFKVRRSVHRFRRMQSRG